jgi:multidrug efflux pump subunit AcrB
MGTAVIGGMVVETFIGRFLVPAIFYVSRNYLARAFPLPV